MLERQSPDTAPSIAPLTAVRVVTRYERLGAMALLAFGMVPLIVAWWLLFRTDLDLRGFIAFNIIGIFCFAVIETFSIILLCGLGRLSLSENLVNWLGAATVGEVAGMVYLIVESVF
jgi:hypothetical protein